MALYAVDKDFPSYFTWFVILKRAEENAIE